MNDGTEVKPRSLRFTWSMKTTSSRDPNESMAEIKKVRLFIHAEILKKKIKIDGTTFFSVGVRCQ